MAIKIFLSLTLVILFCSCTLETYNPNAKSGCLYCHKIIIDENHKFSCVICHEGDENSKKITKAHKGLVKRPSHPFNMMKYCGGCHYERVNFAITSPHFTLQNEISTIFSAFFPDEKEIYNIYNLPFSNNPLNEKEVLSEMLRKRCLLCHPYYEGENYKGTRRGTGCASCHLQNRLSEPKNHRFDNKISDKHCLSCHYGNFVGWDYYGRFEKDYEEDYRDIIEGKFLEREYGVEWHELSEDVHKKAGFSCLDCHIGGFCSNGENKSKKYLISCVDCHDRENALIYNKGKNMVIMNRERIGHRKVDLHRVSCAACHAQWSFNDYGRELTHSITPDFNNWVYLSVQGSSEIEEFFSVIIHDNRKKPIMRDKINGIPSMGLWFMGFYERRWYPIKLGMENENKIVVMRPLLDIKISYFNLHLNKSIYLTPRKEVWIPYFPHTIGKPNNKTLIEIEDYLR